MLLFLIFQIKLLELSVYIPVKFFNFKVLEDCKVLILLSLEI